jgi:DNA-binding transcriptional ArsR family regulator
MTSEPLRENGGPGGDRSGEHPPDPADGMRDLRDPRDMRALAHPIRLALLEALTVHGPLTATQAGALIGESPSSCSFHLRTLARHNFVEETGEGRGRERPWRVISIGTRVSPPFDDLQAEIAAEALSAMYIDRQHERLRDARSRQSSIPREWVTASDDLIALCWVTVEELQELNAEVLQVVMRYRDRLADPALRPEEARLVEILYHAFLLDLGPPQPDAGTDVRAPTDRADPT